jgi:hypothetical protein
MARKARPTLRCLREDLGQAIPRADTPLDGSEHPLLVKAAEQFADDETPHERIVAIDDRVLFKVKVQRWRGAVWVDGEGGPWLGLSRLATGKTDRPMISTPRLQLGPNRPQQVQRCELATA